jgi:tRNA threonylcarbamoyladenosine biosynthesis protein TsaB
MSTTTEWSQPVLTIDTSSPQGSVALYDGQYLSTRSWPAGRSHSTTLLAEIHHLLDNAGVEITAVGAIGVAIGPGTFTGLRVGLGVAKGFHLAIGTPLLGVSTLQATALPFIGYGRTVVAVVAAGRGRLVWAPYGSRDLDLEPLTTPRNTALDELMASLPDMGPVVVTGELSDQEADVVRSIQSAAVPPLPVRLRHPGSFAELTWRRMQRGESDEAASIEPIYLSRADQP